MMDESQFQKMK